MHGAGEAPVTCLGAGSGAARPLCTGASQNLCGGFRKEPSSGSHSLQVCFPVWFEYLQLLVSRELKGCAAMEVIVEGAVFPRQSVAS